MAERHEEKYFITYQQYAQLKERAMQTMVPDVHGVGGSYMITSLYYDDPTGKWHRESIAGSPEKPEELGIELAKIMKGRYE